MARTDKNTLEQTSTQDYIEDAHMADVSNFAPMKLERILEESENEVRKVGRSNVSHNAASCHTSLSRQRKSKNEADANGQSLAGMSFTFELGGNAGACVLVV